MVIWMANWIRLPARQSNSTYEAAVIVSRHTRHIVRWCARLASLPHITRRQQNYVSEFNRRCEKRSPNGPCEMLREMLSRCSQEGSQSREPRSEERRVGKEWRSRLSVDCYKEK